MEKPELLCKSVTNHTAWIEWLTFMVEKQEKRFVGVILDDYEKKEPEQKLSEANIWCKHWKLEGNTWYYYGEYLRYGYTDKPPPFCSDCAAARPVTFQELASCPSAWAETPIMNPDCKTKGTQFSEQDKKKQTLAELIETTLDSEEAMNKPFYKQVTELVASRAKDWMKEIVNKMVQCEFLGIDFINKNELLIRIDEKE